MFPSHFPQPPQRLFHVTMDSESVARRPSPRVQSRAPKCGAAACGRMRARAGNAGSGHFLNTCGRMRAMRANLDNFGYILKTYTTYFHIFGRKWKLYYLFCNFYNFLNNSRRYGKSDRIYPYENRSLKDYSCTHKFQRLTRRQPQETLFRTGLLKLSIVA